MMRIGVRPIELAADPIAPGHFEPGRDNSRLFNLLAEAGVRVVALRLDGMEYKDRLHAIELAGERGVPAVVFGAEMLGYPDLIDRIRCYLHTAARVGVHLVLENDYYSYGDNAEALRTIGQAVGIEGLGFAFAPVYALADKKDPFEEIAVLGRDLRVAYLWDASAAMKVGEAVSQFDPGSIEDQAPGLGEGSVDWPRYFQALAAVGFRDVLCLRWSPIERTPDERVEAALDRAIDYCGRLAERFDLGRKV